MPKVSVIMPTYNVEKYFRQCIESVINQTLTDIEIIPVDDGSPDNCGQIMDEYAAKDSRIKPIHQENGGYGKAVNAGIEAATGEYIGIVETDDWIEPDMYKKLYMQAKKLDVDVCKCDFNYVFSKTRIKPEKQLEKIAKEGVVFTLKENPRIMRHHVSIWSAIYRREYLNKYNIRVIETQSASYQDMPFAALVYAKGARITLIHENLLNYRLEDDMNSSTKRTDSRLRMMPIMCQKAKECLVENNCWDEVKEIAYRHFYNCSFGMWLDTDEQYKKDHYLELKKLFGSMKDDNIKFKCFNKEQKQVLTYIINDDYEKLMKYFKKYTEKQFFKEKRRNLISIRWNKGEKRVILLGRTVLRGKNA